MSVPYRIDGPALVFEFDDMPLINDDGMYLDEQPPQKRKRVDGDDDESRRKRRTSAGAKGSGRAVSLFSTESNAEEHSFGHPYMLEDHSLMTFSTCKRKQRRNHNKRAIFSIASKSPYTYVLHNCFAPS